MIAPRATNSEITTRTVLVTGATGYVGGRLVPRLLDAGCRVRCLGRSLEKLRSRPWADEANVELVQGDLEDETALVHALEGCDAAYYLVHSMQAVGSAYADADRKLASQFATAAERANVSRIIYLGGLGETGDNLSKHLESRRDVEDALQSTRVPVTVLRAAMIIGSGSASFEILRYLVERLPIMVTPRWVHTQCQPIAIDNVLNYLVDCLHTPATIGKTLDIGGADVLTYAELMREVASALGLRKRIVIPVPVLSPRLSSLWIHLVTPISHRIARPLAEGLRNRVVCRNGEANALMPQTLLTAREAINRAINQSQHGNVETAWMDAGPIPGDPDWSGGAVFTDQREIEIDAGAAQVFRAVCKIGGGQGYYAADWLWRVRGVMDRLIGGPGLRRGRRHPEDIGVGDGLDFWRVREVVRFKLLRLLAEMKLPGEAELTFELHPSERFNEGTRLVQTARFKPRGLLGLVYWYAVLPLHHVVFQGMLRGIARAATADAGEWTADTVQASTKSA